MSLHVGDKVIVPWRTDHQKIGGWHEGTVVATRGHGNLAEAVVRCYGYEHVHPVREVKPYPKNKQDWPRT